MKKSVLWMRKILLPTLLALVLSMVIVYVGTALPISPIAQTNSTTTVYLDPPTINGTEIGEEFPVNITISTDELVRGWMAGLTFNATVLNCTGFEEGGFLKSVSDTIWVEGSINNMTGVITAHGAVFKGDYSATGEGRLAYLTFEVIAPGVSDLHLRDVKVTDYDFNVVPTSIIDVYTVVSDTTPYTVVTVSNSTSKETDYGSGFYDHAFNAPAEELSFKVTGPYPGFSNVTIPKTLLNVSTLDEWGVIIDGTPISTEERIPTENTTHTSIYFTYTAGIHNIQIITRELLSSTISISVSPESVNVGSDVTISGDIDPVRENVTVTIQLDSTTLATVKTGSNSHYSYTWTTDEAGTYEIKASWAGDSETEGDESDVKTLTVKGAPAGIPLEYVAAAVVAIIIIIAVVIYFVRFRKPEEE